LHSIDSSQAFDNVNHHAFFIKLMNFLLKLLEFWLTNNWSCIKWSDVFRHFFFNLRRVRQGSVLSLFGFAVYLDDLVDGRNNGRNSFVPLYADDILILTSSLSELQRLLNICENEIIWLDMSTNVDKSCCMRIGPPFDFKCYSIVTISGHTIPWTKELEYLGIIIVKSRTFRFSFDHAKRAYYRSLNVIFGRIGGNASEEVVLQIVTSKCLPMLMYGSEACGIKQSDIRSLEFAVTRFLMKLCKTGDINVIQDCITHFDFKLLSSLLIARTQVLLSKYNACENLLCKLFNDSSCWSKLMCRLQ
jgi:Reverse transcriptase (RNA-dependent DNA polymerase)